VMISLEVRVNGSIIAAATVVNVGNCEDGRCLYGVRSIQFPVSHKDETIVRDFELKHRRDDGAMALISAVAGRMTK
jgi:hypothetical protein